MSVRKVCDDLKLTFGECENDARGLLKRKASRN